MVWIRSSITNFQCVGAAVAVKVAVAGQHTLVVGAGLTRRTVAHGTAASDTGELGLVTDITQCTVGVCTTTCPTFAAIADVGGLAGVRRRWVPTRTIRILGTVHALVRRTLEVRRTVFGSVGAFHTTAGAGQASRSRRFARAV